MLGSMGRERDVARVREWTEPRLLDAVGDIHRERLAEPFDPHRYPEMQGLAQYQDREAKGIADVFGTDFRRILLCQDQYRRLVYLRVSGEAESAPADAGSCTSVIFKESPVGPIVGRNMDSGIGSVAGLQGFGDPVMFRFPEEMGHSYMGTALAVNEHGLTIQGSSIAYAHEPTDAGFWVDIGSAGAALLQHHGGGVGPDRPLQHDDGADQPGDDRRRRATGPRWRRARTPTRCGAPTRRGSSPPTAWPWRRRPRPSRDRRRCTTSTSPATA